MNTLLETKEFLDLLLAGNRLKSSEYAQRYFTRNQSVLDLYENLIKKTMYNVGELWENNKISVATEHLASAIVEAILNEQYQHFNTTEIRTNTALVATVENELHQIGIKMISDVFDINGWKTHFLGSNTPTGDLLNYAKLLKPDMLAISISISSNFPILEAMIIKAKEVLPNTLLLVGGQAFTHGGHEYIAKYEHVIYQPDAYAADLFLKSFRKKE